MSVRGRLKIFLGYSSGVGKSYRMLDEGRRRRERGQDVIVGAVQPGLSIAADSILRQLPRIPMRRCENSAVMDIPAILERNPHVCLVDGMAWDNPPSAAHAHRWQEIEALLDAGIAVVATVNLQFIAERQEAVAAITGRRPAESVPLELLLQSDEIEVVDAPPANGSASALREMALLLAADVVEHQLEAYLVAHGITARWGIQERILVAVTPWAGARAMIDSGRRNADRFQGELLAGYFPGPRLPATEQAQLDANLALARAAGAEIVALPGESPAAALLAFAHTRGVTQVFVSHEIPKKWRQKLRASMLDRLLADAVDLDVRVFPH